MSIRGDFLILEIAASLSFCLNLGALVIADMGLETCVEGAEGAATFQAERFAQKGSSDELRKYSCLKKRYVDTYVRTCNL